MFLQLISPSSNYATLYTCALLQCCKKSILIFIKGVYRGIYPVESYWYIGRHVHISRILCANNYDVIYMIASKLFFIVYQSVHAQHRGKSDGKKME